MGLNKENQSLSRDIVVLMKNDASYKKVSVTLILQYFIIEIYDIAISTLQDGTRSYCSLCAVVM